MRLGRRAREVEGEGRGGEGKPVHRPDPRIQELPYPQIQGLAE